VLCKSAWSSYVKARDGNCRWGEKEVLLHDTLGNLSCAEDQIARYVGGQWVCSDEGTANLVCTKATVDVGSAIPTMTIWGQFCDNPVVLLGQTDGTFAPGSILASGSDFITVDFTGDADPATVKTLVECDLPQPDSNPLGWCELDVAIVPPSVIGSALSSMCATHCADSNPEDTCNFAGVCRTVEGILGQQNF
jgi:hypothetical protein